MDSIAAITVLLAVAPQTSWIQEARLAHGDGGLGHSLALVGDTAVAGLPTGGADGEGQARVLVRTVRASGVSWDLEAVLSAPPGSQIGFGFAVAMAGNRIVVGAPRAPGAGLARGAVHVFERGSSGWSETQVLLAPEGGQRFGFALALGDDRLLVGDPKHSLGTHAPGLVHAYVLAAGRFELEQSLLSADGADQDDFGFSVALLDDRALIGALRTDQPALGLLNTGAAYVFERTGGEWNQTAKLERSAESITQADRLGFAVALGPDTAVVGTPYPAGEAGAVVVFEGPGWSQAAELAAGSARIGDRFGWSLALDCDDIVVGADRDDLDPGVGSQYGAGGEGAVRRFHRQENLWLEAPVVFAGDTAQLEHFGSSVALGGGVLLVGAQLDRPPEGMLGELEGLAYDVQTDTLFGTDTLRDELVVVDSFGVPTPVGPLGFPDVRGLAFESNERVLYGTDVELDLLVRIDPATGAGTAVGPLGFKGIEGLAFHVQQQTLYGVRLPGAGVAGNDSRLVTIDKSSGLALLAGPSLKGPEVRSLAYDPNDKVLYGVDSVTGELLQEGVLGGGVGVIAPGVRGLARGPKVKELYAVSDGAGLCWFGDVATGDFDPLGVVSVVQALASDPEGGTLYAIDLNSDALYELDPGTGFSTLIGPVGFDRLDALEFDSARGVLLAFDRDGDQLVEIDPATGAAIGLGGVGFERVKGLAMDPVTGVLYGSEIDDDLLIAIDVASLSAVAIGPIGAEVRGLAFDPAGTVLYGVDDQARLLEIDVSTGAGTVIGATAAVEGLAWSAAQDALYGFGSGLHRIDPTTGAATPVDQFPIGAVYAFRLSVDPVSYCTAGTSASGCRATLSASGIPSAGAGVGFVITGLGVEGAKSGVFFFGTQGRRANPWGNGTSYQCVAPPVQRAGLLAGSGAPGACDGAFAQDLNALWCASCPKPNANPGAGASVQAQLWYRDPVSTSNQTTSLSDALEFVVTP